MTPHREPISSECPNFSIREVRCRCCGASGRRENYLRVARVLEKVRERVGAPLYVHSWHRCPRHNKVVGGKPNSYHLQTLAADVTCKTLTPEELQKVVKEMREEGEDIGGIGSYPGFTHIDCGPRRDWSE